MEKLKSFDEIRKDLQRCGIARFYYQAVKRMLLRMFDADILPNKEPKIERGTQKQIGDKKWGQYISYHLFKQMLQDNILIDAYLLGEEIIPRYTYETDKKGKEWVKVKYYPKSLTKTVIIFQDGDDNVEE